jgi:hypothetical protein
MAHTSSSKPHKNIQPCKSNTMCKRQYPLNKPKSQAHENPPQAQSSISNVEHETILQKKEKVMCECSQATNKR